MMAGKPSKKTWANRTLSIYNNGKRLQLLISYLEFGISVFMFILKIYGNDGEG